MAYLIILGISVILCGGFIGLTMLETSRGVRIFEGPRAKLDRHAARFFFIVDHVDWSEFLSHSFRSLLVRIVHDIAFVSLALVRYIERQLTRAIRYLRDRRPNVLAPTASRQSILDQATSYVQNRMHREPSRKVAAVEEETVE